MLVQDGPSYAQIDGTFKFDVTEGELLAANSHGHLGKKFRILLGNFHFLRPCFGFY